VAETRPKPGERLDRSRVCDDDPPLTRHNVLYVADGNNQGSVAKQASAHDQLIGPVEARSIPDVSDDTKALLRRLHAKADAPA